MLNQAYGPRITDYEAMRDWSCRPIMVQASPMRRLDAASVITVAWTEPCVDTLIA